MMRWMIGAVFLVAAFVPDLAAQENPSGVGLGNFLGELANLLPAMITVLVPLVVGAILWPYRKINSRLEKLESKAAETTERTAGLSSRVDEGITHVRDRLFSLENPREGKRKES